MLHSIIDFLCVSKEWIGSLGGDRSDNNDRRSWSNVLGVSSLPLLSSWKLA